MTRITFFDQRRLSGSPPSFGPVGSLNVLRHLGKSQEIGKICLLKNCVAECEACMSRNNPLQCFSWYEYSNSVVSWFYIHIPPTKRITGVT